MSQINIKNLCNENEDGAPTIVGVSTFSATSYMCPPKGTTAQRPENPVSGSLRFNTDTASLEYYKGNTIGWTQIEMTSPDLGGGTGSNTGTGTRGIFAGGHTGPTGPGYTNEMDFLTISTLGNTQDFGDLSAARGNGVGGMASRTRGIVWGGIPAGTQIDKVTIASAGTGAASFGTANLYTEGGFGCSNNIRAIQGGGFDRPNSFAQAGTLQYITIASEGASVTFGGLSTPSLDQRAIYGGSFASSTRGIWGGGDSVGVSNINIMSYVTIMTTGNSVDFGDLETGAYNIIGCSNSTRGIWFGGTNPTPAGHLTKIQYNTIATLGNSIDFGDLVFTGTAYFTGGQNCASSTRAIAAGGNGGGTNIMEYVEIATTGNALDFGDCAVKYNGAGFSNGHGGL